MGNVKLLRMFVSDYFVVVGFFYFDLIFLFVFCV
jgi:hypothetical protein